MCTFLNLFFLEVTLVYKFHLYNILFQLLYMLHVLTTQNLIFIYLLYPFCAPYPLPSGNYSGLIYEFFWFSIYWIFKDRVQYQITGTELTEKKMLLIHKLFISLYMQSLLYAYVIVLIHTSNISNNMQSTTVLNRRVKYCLTFSINYFYWIKVVGKTSLKCWQML